MKKILLSLLALLLVTQSAQAHSVWINAFQSTTHKPGHIMVSLGWGHTMPMDDILNSPNGRVELEHFSIIDPSLKKTALILPDTTEAKVRTSTTNFDIFPGDLAVQKIALKKDNLPGVYQISATSKPTFYTQYIDKKGHERLKLQARDQINDAQKVLMSVKFQAFAKSYATFGDWVQPKPLGHGLELIPRTDLSNLHKGDLVEFDILFYGKPLHTTAKSIEYLTAHSAEFGQNDGFSLFSYIMNGKAQFRVQSAGQWMVNVNHKDDVTADGPLKSLRGKADHVYHSASLTFNVQ